MGKSLRDNRANLLFLHDEFNMQEMIGFHLNFKMTSVVEFNLKNQSDDCLGVNPRFVFLNRTSWG